MDMDYTKVQDHEKEPILVIKTGSKISQDMCRFMEDHAVTYTFHVITLLQFDTDELRNYITENKVRSAIAFGDAAAIFLSVLKHVFPQFSGPSLMSSFFCYNKFFAHQILDPNPIPHCFLDLREEADTSDEAMRKIFSVTGIPAFLKPTTSTGSKNLYLAHNEDQLRNAIKKLQQSFSSTTSNIDIQHFIDCRKFPLHVSSGALAMKYMPQTTKLTVHGFVFRRKIYHWIIGDLKYWPGKPEVFQMIIFPSCLDSTIQDKAKFRYREIATALIDHGYDNQFLEIEMFVTDTQEVHLMEVNGRVAFADADRQAMEYCLHNGNVFKASLDLARNKLPVLPVLNGKKCAVGSIRAIQSGRMGDTLDVMELNKIRTAMNRVPVSEDDMITCEPAYELSGVRLQLIMISGDTYDEYLYQLKIILKKIFKNPNHIKILETGKEN